MWIHVNLFGICLKESDFKPLGRLLWKLRFPNFYHSVVTVLDNLFSLKIELSKTELAVRIQWWRRSNNCRIKNWDIVEWMNAQIWFLSLMFMFDRHIASNLVRWYFIRLVFSTVDYEYESKGPGFITTKWLQGWLNSSSVRSQSNEHQKPLCTY